MNNDCKCNKSRVYRPDQLRGTKPLSPKCGKPGVFFTTEVIKSYMGTSNADSVFPPKNGRFFNTLVTYEADGARFLYDSEGNYTELTGATTEEIQTILEEKLGDYYTKEEIDELLEDVTGVETISDTDWNNLWEEES